MIYHLALAAGATITPEMATCLYAAVLTDTGAFSFSNTNARTHTIAADLMSHGVPARIIHEQLVQPDELDLW